MRQVVYCTFGGIGELAREVPGYLAVTTLRLDCDRTSVWYIWLGVLYGVVFVRFWFLHCCVWEACVHAWYCYR